MKICMVLHKPVRADSRVRREAAALTAAGHEVTVVELAQADGAAPDGDAAGGGAAVVSVRPPPPLKRLLPLRAYRLAFGVMIVRRVVAARPDAVHAHDAAMLAPGWLAARLCGALLVYDTHELATGVPYRSRGWALLVAAVERTFVCRSAAVITVSDGIAARLQSRYRLARRPTVLRNLPDTTVSAPASDPGDLRARHGIGKRPLILHQGAPAPERGCEALIRSLHRLDDAHVVFLGDAEAPYGATLVRLVRSEGLEPRVHFEPSVPLEGLLDHTRQADVGVSLLADSCDNHRLALPNKVFEYLAAGLPVVVSRLPELAALVERFEVGVAVDPADPDATALGIERALALRGEERFASGLVAFRAELDWARERERLTGLYARLQADGAPSRAH